MVANVQSPGRNRLPPNSRDFELFRVVQVNLVSTRDAAQRFGISQTRVRQVVARVGAWLAEALPVKTAASLEQEALLARHLAAERMQSVLETLTVVWKLDYQPKHHRQLQRTIEAQARLGLVPGQIEAAMADAQCALEEAEVAGVADAPPSSVPPAEDCSPQRPANALRQLPDEETSGAIPDAAEAYAAPGRCDTTANASARPVAQDLLTRDAVRESNIVVRIAPDFPGAEVRAQLGAQEMEETRNRATLVARSSSDGSPCDIRT